MRYVLTLSPETRRGFSGEGSVLDSLISDDAAGDADLIGALLSFEPRVEVDLLASRAGLDAVRTRAALTQLSTGGKVGYDTAEAAFFHRELPYDASRVAAMNPRLRAARALVDQGTVRSPEAGVVLVASGENTYQVRSETSSCTCPWWGEHRGGRGPCKHVLAAHLFTRPEA
jgi:hypothetical protein